MAIPTGAPGTISSGTINQLPDWYTNYAKNVTNLGSSLLGSLPGYNGYVDANGNPAPMVAGLSGTQQQGINNAKANVNSFIPGISQANNAVNGGTAAVQSGLGTLGNATNTINGATGSFNSANNAYGQSLGTINNGLGQVAGASGSINNMGGALQQAQSYLNPSMAYAQAGANGSEFSADKMKQYMNPYLTGVNNEIARLANQNLTENVLPGVNSTFTGAGQFGSSRNADFTNRAIRDNQATITGAQSKVLADAQAQALDQAAAASNRNLQAGQQIGALSGLATNVASGYGNQAGTQIAQGAATINGAQAQQGAGAGYNAVGNSILNQGQALGQIGGQQIQGGQALGGLGSIYGNLTNNMHDMQLQDTQALLGSGMLEQQTNQAGMDAAYKDFMDRRDYPTQQLGALSQLLPNVSGKIQPNTQTMQVNATQPTDKFQSLADLFGGLAYM